MRKEIIKNTKTVVIKVGTSTLTHLNGCLNEDSIKNLVMQICELKKMDLDVILVSSGAVGAGMGKLNIDKKPNNLIEKQALAAVGQVGLMHLYERIFWAYSKTIGQILLTKSDFSDRKRYLNARSVCKTLLDKGIIPIINENDTINCDEIKVGDNDTLSALVCGLVDADLLIILSDIDGLYDKNPSKFSDAKFINLVKQVDDKVFSMAEVDGSALGTGGMSTKLVAATMTNKIGTNLILANGKKSNVLIDILLAKDIGTLFLSDKNGHINSRKYWLAYGTTSKGSIDVDSGAVVAIKDGKSLLSVGIKDVLGEFYRGDIVEIIANNNTIARGISNYSSLEILKIKGYKSCEIFNILEYKSDDDVIHSDNLVLN